MDTYAHSDGVFTFEGCASVDVTDGVASPWRVDCARPDLFPFLSDGPGRACSGVRLCFTTDTRDLCLELGGPVEGMPLDLYADDERAEELDVPRGHRSAVFRPLPAGKKRIEIWLPHVQRFSLGAVAVDRGARIHKTPVTRKRWITYGSSITHAGSARRPSEVWPALVARELGLHLTSFGFGGSCVLEPMMAFLIRDLPADAITLKLGINCYHGALSARTFGPNAIGLIRIIRETRPATPIAVVSPILCPTREEPRGESHLSLCEMRDILAGIVEDFRRHGDANLHYVDGRKVFGKDEVRHLPDQLHPDAEGQFPLARNFIRHVFEGQDLL